MSLTIAPRVGGKEATAGRLSIRTYLLILISLAIVFPLAASSVLGRRLVNSLFEQELTERGTTVVHDLAESSHAFLRSAVIFIESVVADEPFLGDAEPSVVRGHLRSELALNPGFESLAFIDERGVQVASYPPDHNNDGLDLSDRDYARPSVGVPLVSESYISSSSGRPVVSIASRLREHGLTIVGFLDLSQLSDYVFNAAGPDWTLLITDGSGTIIAARDKKLVLERTNVRNLLPEGGASETGRISLRTDTSRLSFSRKLGDYGWSVIATYDPKAFLGSLDRILSVTLLDAVIAFLVLYTVVLLMAGRIIGDISLLHSSVRAIRDRRYGEIRPRPAFAEFRDLIGDVSSMESAVEEREAQLTDMVRQRDTLLREVHHRVKNNMQIVSSLLSLQKDAMVESEATIALTESSARIQALALVHEFLYRGGDFSKIDLGEYFRELCSGLVSSYGVNGVELFFSGEGVEIESDRAIPVGLVMTEIVTNSLKHAFKGRERGRISITLESSEEEIVVTIADDGPGFVPDEAKRSLGLQLIGMLLTQIGGDMTRTFEGGTTYRVVLPRR